MTVFLLEEDAEQSRACRGCRATSIVDEDAHDGHLMLNQAHMTHSKVNEGAYDGLIVKDLY